MTNIKNPDEYPKMLHYAFNSICHDTLSKIGFVPMEFEIRSLEICDSTNDIANDLLENHHNSIVLSMVQAQGRGRERRKWYSPIGGVWLSIGISSSSPVVELSTPVVQAVQEVLNRFVTTEIKAPNDILCFGKKLCGVLVETKSLGNHFEKIIIGIGVNVYNVIPEEVFDLATRLSDFCNPPSIPELATMIVESVLNSIRNMVYV